MASGRVKWFRDDKGYGFIEVEDRREDVFVHYSQILAGGFRFLRAGDKVHFTIVETEKGRAALAVTKCE